MSAHEDELEAIVARAREDAEAFLRAEWRGRQRECLFAAGGIFMIGSLLALCMGGLYSLDPMPVLAGVLVVTAASMVWCVARWRCPRCERIPLTGFALLAHRVYAPELCPHCHLDLTQEERKLT